MLVVLGLRVWERVSSDRAAWLTAARTRLLAALAGQ